ncbi:MAG TPA: PAS domain-containing protein [Roseateles sp.]
MEAGELGIWDLRLDLDTVHHSPQWKQRLGFPEPHSADSTHFWRCRVHPADLEGMLRAMRAHVDGSAPCYEAGFRLRSNGSGYRRVHSRGRVVERNADGRALRMIGTMLDLTPRPATPRAGLPELPQAGAEVLPQSTPFHLLLAGAVLEAGAGQDRVLSLVGDLLQASLEHLDGLQDAR